MTDPASPDRPRTRRLLRWGLGVLVLIGGAALLIYAISRPDARTAALDADRLAPPPDPLAPSTLALPVTYDLGPTLNRLDEALPRQYGNLSEVREQTFFPNLRYVFEAERRA